jgi:hypothetical protein
MSHAEDLVVQTAGVNDVWHYNEVHLDSAGRDSGDNNSPSFFLSQPISDVMGIKVLAARLPFSWYLVNDANRKFTFRYRTPNGAGTLADGRPVLGTGSYADPPSLAQALCDAVNADKDSTALSDYELRYVFDPASGTVTFRWWRLSADDWYAFPDGWGFDFDADEPTASYYGPARQLGWDAGVDHLASGGTLRTGICNVAGPNYVSLVSNLAGRISPRVHVNGSSTPSPALVARVPVDVPAFGIVDYTDPNPGFCFDTGLDQLQRIDLSWRLGNDYDTVLDFNGQPWSVVVQILTQRDTTAGRTLHLTHDAGPGGRKRVRVQ